MPNLYLRLHDDGEQNDAKEQSAEAPLGREATLAVLREAEFTASKLIPWGSNYTFAVALEGADGHEQLAIYKPEAGERPLYDFPRGTLYLREHASYLLSHRLGWDIVPPTVIRHGPHGIGSVQLYIEPKADRGDDHAFWEQHLCAIERLVLFDHVTNNADRKLTHCLLDRDDRVWGIDHGLTFNAVPKLRTVLWQYTDEPIAPDLRADLCRLQMEEREVREDLRDHLNRRELDALFKRTRRLVDTGMYPRLDPYRNVPYGWW